MVDSTDPNDILPPLVDHLAFGKDKRRMRHIEEGGKIRIQLNLNYKLNRVKLLQD